MNNLPAEEIATNPHLVKLRERFDAQLGWSRAHTESLFNEIERQAVLIADLQQFKEWAEPQCQDWGRMTMRIAELERERDNLIWNLAAVKKEVTAITPDWGRAMRILDETEFSQPSVPANDGPLRIFAEWAAGASCHDDHAPAMVKHIAENARGALDDAGLSPPPNDDVEKLRAFAQRILMDWPDTPDIDGGDLQELAVKSGLLEGHEVTQACGETCTCADYDEFPMTCYRKTDLLMGRLQFCSAHKGRNRHCPLCNPHKTVPELNMLSGETSDQPCKKCGQIDHGQYGEYPCSKCGLPVLHDETKEAVIACGQDLGFNFKCRRGSGHAGPHTHDPMRLVGEPPVETVPKCDCYTWTDASGNLGKSYCELHRLPPFDETGDRNG